LICRLDKIAADLKSDWEEMRLRAYFPRGSEKNMIEILAQIRGASFTAGIVLFDDKVVETVPLVRYMRGWSRDRNGRFIRRPHAQFSASLILLISLFSVARANKA
jgi:hypothetical protein